VLGRAALETEGLAGFVNIERFGMSKQFAQVVEMGLGGGTLGQLNGFPFGDEVGSRHGCGVCQRDPVALTLLGAPPICDSADE